MAVVREVLDDKKISQAKNVASEISIAKVDKINPEAFTFFANFDGTNNKYTDLSYSGDKYPTNVGEIFKAAEKNKSENFDVEYYPGPGTRNSLDFTSGVPNGYVIDQANLAYNDFSRGVIEWHKKHPDGDINITFSAFSRGGGTAAVFTQFVNERGVKDPETNEWIVKPGEAKIAGGILFDPVTTGIHGNMAFPPQSKNLAIIQAENEYRDLFKATDYSQQQGATVFNQVGNHCDIGGGYDNGLGSLNLEAATKYLQNMGLKVNDVDPSRRFDVSNPVQIHDEAVSANGKVKWESNNPLYGRVLNHAVEPAKVSTSEDGRVIGVSFKNAIGHDVVQTYFNNEGNVSGRETTISDMNGKQIGSFYDEVKGMPLYQPSTIYAPSDKLLNATKGSVETPKELMGIFNQLEGKGEFLNAFSAEEKKNILLAISQEAYTQGAKKLDYFCQNDKGQLLAQFDEFKDVNLDLSSGKVKTFSEIDLQAQQPASHELKTASSMSR